MESYIIIYVDNILIASKDTNDVTRVENDLAIEIIRD